MRLVREGANGVIKAKGTSWSGEQMFMLPSAWNWYAVESRMSISPSMDSNVPMPKVPCWRSVDMGMEEEGEARPDMRADIMENW